MLTFDWYHNGVLKDEVEANSAYDTRRYNEAGEYYVVARGSYGRSVKSATCVVSLKKAPEIPFFLQDLPTEQSAPKGSMAYLEIETSKPCDVFWQKERRPHKDGKKNTKMDIIGVSESGNYRAWCVVTLEDGTKTNAYSNVCKVTIT